jgi:hypothetical protein
MSASRRDASAARLPDGRVLASGGCDGNACTSAEIYDPASGLWSGAAPMNVARVGQTATVLTSGHVLVIGGGTATSEVYDQATGIWTPNATMAFSRTSHTATRLPSGVVLVTGAATAIPAARQRSGTREPDSFVPRTC